MKRIMQTALTLGALSLAAGCYIDFDDGYYADGYGELTVYYTFDGRLCDEVGVERIHVSLEGREYGDRYVDTLRCSRYRDGVTVYDLYSDVYDVRVV